MTYRQSRLFSVGCGEPFPTTKFLVGRSGLPAPSSTSDVNRDRRAEGGSRARRTLDLDLDRQPGGARDARGPSRFSLPWRKRIDRLFGEPHTPAAGGAQRRGACGACRASCLARREMRSSARRARSGRTAAVDAFFRRQVMGRLRIIGAVIARFGGSWVGRDGFGRWRNVPGSGAIPRLAPPGVTGLPCPSGAGATSCLPVARRAIHGRSEKPGVFSRSLSMG